jgi:transposase
MVAGALKHIYNQEFNMIPQQFSNFIGIDVSKDKIDVFSSLDSKLFQLENTKKSISKVFKKFDSSSSYVVLENTGGYEKKCVDTLIGLNFTVHRTDNRKAKHFMDSIKYGAKTDGIDAKKLSQYGQERHPELPVYTKPSENQEKIRELSMYLEEVKVYRAGQKNRLQSPGCEMITPFIAKAIEDLNLLVDSVENQINELLEKEQALEEKIKLLCEYPGVGRISAIRLLAHMPELGTLNRREVAALAGLAPFAKDSGKKQGHRRIRGGRQIIRKTLYMIAFSFCRKSAKGPLGDYYASLLKREKKKMVAITALMRKIIVQLNAILRDGKIISNTH